MKYAALVILFLILGGCTSITELNINRADIQDTGRAHNLTFSDYGSGIELDESTGLHKYVAYIGGFGGCKRSVLIYAKPTMDRYMTDNGYSDYSVVETHHVKSPPTRCELFIEFKS